MVLSEIALEEPLIITMARKHLAKKLRVSYAVRWPLHSPDDLIQIVSIAEAPHLEKWSGAPNGELVYNVGMFDQKQTVFTYTFGVKELESMDTAFDHGEPTHMVLHRRSMFD